MPRWTPASRLTQAAAIRGWMPWTLSTGPRTAEGKSRSCLNGWKGGVRAKVMRWRQVLRQMQSGMEKAMARVKVISSVRRKRCFKPSPKPAPMAWTLPGWDEDVDDIVARMSPAEVAEACQRLLKAQGGLKP